MSENEQQRKVLTSDENSDMLPDQSDQEDSSCIHDPSDEEIMSYILGSVPEAKEESQAVMEAKEIVGIVRYGHLSCSKCIVDSMESSAFKSHECNEDYLKDKGIKLVRRRELKGEEVCHRCGRTIK